MTERPEEIAQVAAAIAAAMTLANRQDKPAIQVEGSGQDLSQLSRGPEEGAQPAVSGGDPAADVGNSPNSDYPIGYQGTGTTP